MNSPNGSGRIVTNPLSASSKTVADTVVLIGTPSLLLYVEKVYDTEWKTKAGDSLKGGKSLLSSQEENSVKMQIRREAN